MTAPALRWLAVGLGCLMTTLAPRSAGALEDVAFGQLQEELRIVGRDAGDTSGASVAVGDVSGDGIADVVVGAPQSGSFDNTRERGGEVSVVFGGLALPKDIGLANADRAFYGATASARLGTAVALIERRVLLIGKQFFDPSAVHLVLSLEDGLIPVRSIQSARERRA